MRLDENFFKVDAITLAKNLIGKDLVTCVDGTTRRLMITEAEVYMGEGDTACHAHKGKTERNSVLWEKGGTVYVYLCYGMHNLVNIVSGDEGDPQAVLIRACEEKYNGPGKLTKYLQIDRSLNKDLIYKSDKIWIEDNEIKVKIKKAKRVGIDYATERDKNRLWRFCLDKIV